MPIGFDYGYNLPLTKGKRKQIELWRRMEHKRQHPLLYDHYGKRKAKSR